MTKTDLIFNLTAPYDNMYQGNARRYLFVCSAGLLRSPTAAAVAIKNGYNARSCGSAEYALIPLSVNLLEWAHKIVFMNESNYMDAMSTFRPLRECVDLIKQKAIVWEIEDEHNYMATALVQEVSKLLELIKCHH